MTIILGIDAAWTTVQPSGLALVSSTSDSWCLIFAGLSDSHLVAHAEEGLISTSRPCPTPEKLPVSTIRSALACLREHFLFRPLHRLRALAHWKGSGTGKTHVALGLGLAACQKGMSVGFTTASALVSEMMEARDERRLLRLQKQMAAYQLLIIDELGFVPLSKTGAELLFELISQRYERGATLITSNLPFDEWTETLGSERLTGALLDRITHHVNILEMNGDSYRLAQSRARKAG